MARPEHGLPKGFQLRAVLANEATFMIGEAFPQQDPRMGGRPRHYPTWVFAVFVAMITTHTSARKAATEMGDCWPEIRREGRDRYPDDPTMWAPRKPVRRHHWQHMKRLIKDDPAALEAILDAFETSAAQLAAEAGVCDPNGGGSLTRPTLDRIIIGDGKVIKPLFRAKKGTRRVDRETGEILGDKKYDPDAKMHTTGGGHPVYGNKFVILASRREGEWHSRWIHGFAHVPTAGGEAKAAMSALGRVTPRLPGAQAILYDGAMRGMHHRESLRHLGIQMISPPAAARAETKETPRESKTTFIESIAHPDDPDRLLGIYTSDGVPGVIDHDAAGEPHFTPLERLKVYRRRNVDGTWRWYCDYALPASFGGSTVVLRMDTTDDDIARGVNRSENLRITPPADPDYDRIYPLRSDIEACNRQLDDTLWLRRAHSVGAPAQLLDLVGFGLVYNSVALARRRQANAPPDSAAA